MSERPLGRLMGIGASLCIVIRKVNPKLPVEPTVVVPPEIHLPIPRTGSLGDLLSSILGPPSNGTGSGGGGVGSGYGPGVGPGY